MTVLLVSEPGTAQLLSPGKLAAPHSDLEGLRSCTNCHVLGERGISSRLCLDCHVPIRNRLAQESGFHANVAEQQCSECHKDHFGDDFQLVRFDTTSFAHSSVGFDLVDAHRSLKCADCHQPRLISAADVRAFKGEHDALEKTLLGLGTTCSDCHASTNPHGEQFVGRSCTECHGQTIWNELLEFDHSRTQYRLTGRHRQLSCDACHQPARTSALMNQVQYVNLRFSRCASCHQDIHQGSMGSDCTSCHTTAGWDRLDRSTLESRFDHEITGYQLVSAHAELTCSLCHDPNQAQRTGMSITYVDGDLGKAYPAPTADSCTSCHLDYHEGVFRESPGGSGCDGCHLQNGWLPTSYDVMRHNIDTRFSLIGAHVATPCLACHNTSTSDGTLPQFRFESLECRSCHTTDDPHEEQFVGRQCTECHDTEAFTIAAFDHSTTSYQLDGAHRDLPCNACHYLDIDQNGREYRVYRPLGMECGDCHGGT